MLTKEKKKKKGNFFFNKIHDKLTKKPLNFSTKSNNENIYIWKIAHKVDK